MIMDLLGSSGPVALDADVLLIGAGIAGLLASTRLAQAGLRVVVCESGAEQQVEETHPLNEVVHRRSYYHGAAHGRFRCLGGTSTRWGGAMIPFQPADFETAGSLWPLSYEELIAYQPQVEKLFQLPSGPYDDPSLMTRPDGTPPSFLGRLAKWPPFVKRNVARLLRADIAEPENLSLWLNATVTQFHLAPDGRLTSIEARAPDGGRLTVRATETVVAAGSIESTRLLLLMDRAHGGRLFGARDVLGRYFHDHLSARVGTLAPYNIRALNRIVGFRFEEGGMCNLRFEPAPSPPVRALLSAGFAHFVITSDKRGGFDLLRDFYRQLQKGRRPRAATLFGLAVATPWLLRAAWWYKREHRLLYPPGAKLELHMVVDQVPRADNRLTLSEDRTDRYGQPLAVIDWSIGEQDERNLMTASRTFAEDWNMSTLAHFGTVELGEAAETMENLAQGGGIYHPGGSTRMGTDAALGVVDRDLRTFAVRNLSVLSTSTFPTGGGANPTMMLMMATLRAADDIGRRLQRRLPDPKAL